jgi:hypothetical protein
MLASMLVLMRWERLKTEVQTRGFKALEVVVEAFRMA